jgi:hypothetical protein
MALGLVQGQLTVQKGPDFMDVFRLSNERRSDVVNVVFDSPTTREEK